MIEKKVQIDGKEVTFATSARTPRLYRQYFRRDVMTDMASLYNKVQAMIKAKENAKSFEDLSQIEQLSALDLTIFENLAFVMAKQGGDESQDADEWLDQFDTFDIYQIFPQLFELWSKNMAGMSIPKKK